MIREIFSSIKHNKARTLLILLLNGLTFFLSLLTLTNSFAFYTQMSEVRKMFLGDLGGIYRVDGVLVENEDSIGADIEELKTFVNSRENSVCGSYHVMEESFSELKEDPEYIALNRKAGAEYPSYSKVVYIDTEILGIVNSGLTESDFQPVRIDGELYTPLYAGKKLEGLLSVGDTLTSGISGEKYIVAGFLKNKKWFDSSDPITFPLISMDHAFVSLFSRKEMELSLNHYNMAHYSMIGRTFMICSEETAEEFGLMAAEKGLKFKITTIGDFMEQWTISNEKYLKQLLFLAVIVLTCSSISIVSILCVNVLLKKREYGIRMAFGGSKEKIISAMFFEIVFLNLISGTAAFALAYRSYLGGIIKSLREVYLKTLCSFSLLCLAGLIMIAAAVIFIVPARLLKRYDPAVLIKEEE